MGRVGTHKNVEIAEGGKIKCTDCGLVTDGHEEMEDTMCSE